MKYFVVDAFTDRPYKGNPAAVFIIDEFPEDETCQNIAAEINLSETVFVKHLDTNRFHIRWFTPKVEIKLCGHATLATAHILHQEKLVEGKEIRFESLSGQLKVYFVVSIYTLDFPLPQTEVIPVEPSSLNCDFGTVTQAARIDDDVIVELANEEQVRKYTPRLNELERVDFHLIVITTKGNEGGPYDFVSRVFAPSVGVLEDPVTGSAHCKLALYWQKRLNKSNFVAYQASRRGGEVRISIIKDRVHLSGYAVTISSGTWLVPLLTSEKRTY